MSNFHTRRDIDETTRSTVERALAALRREPAFVEHLDKMQQLVRDSVVGAGITENQIQLSPDSSKKDEAGHAERVGPGHICLLMLFDECYFSIKVY